MMNLVIRNLSPAQSKAAAIVASVDQPDGWRAAKTALADLRDLEEKALRDLRAAQQRLDAMSVATVPARPSVSPDELGELRSALRAAVDLQADCQRRASEQRRVLDDLRPQYGQAVTAALVPFRKKQAERLIAKLIEASEIIAEIEKTDAALADVGISNRTRMLPAAAFLGPVQQTAEKITIED
jgi:hypothetical protein